jgi:glyoxylase-like metal-dependent hydrolase (beta-lactamase superfamily II)
MNPESTTTVNLPLMNRLQSRRDALGTIALAAAAVSIGVTKPARAQDTRTIKSLPNSGTYRFSVGKLQVTVLSDGYGIFPANQPTWAPEATAHDLQKALTDAFLPTDQLTLSFNPILIDTGKDLLLCDTGSGKLLAPTTGRLLQQLRTAGYEPDQVTGVFLSHAHVDHLGGLLTDDGKPVFSSAQHFVHEPEWSFWTAKKPDLSKQRLDDKSKAEFIQLAQKTFGTLEGNFKRVPAGTSLIDGVVVGTAPGHTPGHTLLRIQSDKQELVHFFDLAHHPVIMFKNPAWTVAFDTDAALAAATRKKLFAEFAANRTRVLGYHLPFPGIGHIAKDGSGYRWVPEAWQQT